jgi:lipoprotein-anchoring transpeptidase ErfK/SrfK
MRMTTRLSVLLAALMAVLVFAVTAHAGTSTPTVKLLVDADVRAYPGGGSTVATVKASRPLTGAPTVLPVIGRAHANGRPWVRVRLPQRPNHGAGWIPADGTRSGRAAWRVNVNRSTRTATVYRSGKTVKRFRVVVGKAATPTPAGTFFVAERVKQPHGSYVGPFVLALSAYSKVLQEFDGGPGQIGLHGRTGLPDPLGSAASHGCVRFDDSAIAWLAERLTAGSLVNIR